MKRLIPLTILLLLLLTVPVFAHPGGTDSSGGHYDRSDGSYHYHHGQPAHLHTDGICPYENSEPLYEAESYEENQVTEDGNNNSNPKTGYVHSGDHLPQDEQSVLKSFLQKVDRGILFLFAVIGFGVALGVNFWIDYLTTSNSLPSFFITIVIYLCLGLFVTEPIFVPILIGSTIFVAISIIADTILP